MKTKYQVIATFRSEGRLRESYEWRAMSSFRWGRQANLAQAVDSHSAEALPVAGAPMRAKDTLLAALLRNSKTAAVLMEHQRGGEALDEITSARYYSNALLLGVYSTRRAIQCIRQQMEPMPNRVRRGVETINPRRISALTGKLISVEIECYSKQWPNDTGVTSVVHDGSIGDSHLGREGREIRRVTWVSNGRLNGLLGLAKYLKDARIDKRCGLHVHVDARHLPLVGDEGPLHTAAETHRRIVEMQKHLKKLIPRSRWSNKYCRFGYNGELEAPNGVATRSDRYCAVNWHSYREHGSIEFRCGSGSVNTVKIESWALLCSYLLNYASLKENAIPKTWHQFLAILPGWLQQWCILRHCKLHGGLISITSRVASAADLDIPADTTFVE